MTLVVNTMNARSIIEAATAKRAPAHHGGDEHSKENLGDGWVVEFYRKNREHGFAVFHGDNSEASDDRPWPCSDAAWEKFKRMARAYALEIKQGDHP